VENSVPTIFFSYSHSDETFRDQLETHLSGLKRQKAISSWHDRKIVAGSAVDETIDRHLDAADVILLLISPDFIASDYCYDKEVQRALQRHAEGTARVIPVILRPCDWHGLLFGELLATPTDGRAITLWPNRDEAFLDVVKSIKFALQDLGRFSTNSVATPPVAAAPSPIPSQPFREVKVELGGAAHGHPVPSNTAPLTASKETEAKGRARAPSQLPSVGVDLGTTSARIYIEGRGIVLDEHSVLAVDGSSRRIFGVGDSALELLVGRRDAQLIHPLSESVVSDPDAAFQMLSHFLKALGVQPGSRVVFAVPEVATKASLKVLFEVAKRAKLGRVEFVRRTFLAAISDCLPVKPLHSGMVVEIGAGTTDVTVLSESRVYHSFFVRTGGNNVDEAIIRFMRRAFNQIIGERTAEFIKIHLGSAWPLAEKQSMGFKGRNAIEGVVKTTVLTDGEVRNTIQECIEPIARLIREARDRTPPSIFSAATDDVVVLGGGGALIRGIGEFFQDRLQIRVLTQKDPLRSVVSGFGPLFDGDWKPAEPLVYPPLKLRPALVPGGNAEVSTLQHP
jgi:rod shape-determining protein MreB